MCRAQASSPHSLTPPFTDGLWGFPFPSYFVRLLCHLICTRLCSPIFWLPETVKALGMGVHRATGRMENGQAVGKSLNRSPALESLYPESCLQTARPAARPLCIRIRVNKAWGVRAAVCQECCKPFPGGMPAPWQQELGRQGRYGSWLGTTSTPLTSQQQQLPVSFAPSSPHCWPHFREDRTVPFRHALCMGGACFPASKTQEKSWVEASHCSESL